MNASIWQGPSGPLIGHIFLGVLSKLKPRASSALVETVYGMDEGTIGPLWARNTPSANEIRTAHGRICIFILLEADRTSIPSIVSHGRTMNVVVVDIRRFWKLHRSGPVWARQFPETPLFVHCLLAEYRTTRTTEFVRTPRIKIYNFNRSEVAHHEGGQ